VRGVWSNFLVIYSAQPKCTAKVRGLSSYSPYRDTDWKFSDAECADTAYVGARRPCKALLGRRVRKLYARSAVAQTIAA